MQFISLANKCIVIMMLIFRNKDWWFCYCLVTWQWGEARRQCSRLKLVDLIVKPWQHLTKYKLLLYAMRKPLDKMEPSPDVDEQRTDIADMVLSAFTSINLN